jgi:hypothetical protein
VVKRKKFKKTIQYIKTSIMLLFLEHIFNVVIGESDINLNLSNTEDFVEISLNNDIYAVNFIMKKEKMISQKSKNQKIKASKTCKAYRIEN